MGELNIRVCTDEDLEMLASLNKQLIEDEKHDNQMNLNQLGERMKEFISTDYEAYFFIIKNTIVGYALVNKSKDPLYLRQFFISRNERRKGYGSTALEMLLKLLDTDTIDLEVMSWNERGINFWRTMGFEDRSIYMRLHKKQ